MLTLLTILACFHLLSARRGSKGSRGRDSRRTNCLTDSSYDYIIVGAGSAGSVLAQRLSEDSRNSVLLIEEGGWSNQWDIVNNAVGWFSVLLEPQLDRDIYTEPESELNNRSIWIPRAKMTGGCDSHKAMVHYLNNRNDIDQRWQVDDWNWEDLSPYWEEINSTYRNTRCDTIDAHWIQEFLDAAEEQNYTYTYDLNDLDNLDPNTSYASVRRQSSIPDGDLGMRISVWTEFIETILPRDNLHIMTYTRVNKILIGERNTARGVEIYGIGDGKTRNVYAKKEVIISGGVFESPKILMLSGIGDCDYLDSMGIECLVNVPGVGKNLQDHTIAFLDSPPFSNNNLEEINWPFEAKSEYGLYGTLNIGENTDYYCGLGIETTESGDVFIQITAEVFQYAFRGEVLLADLDPSSTPIVHMNYLTGDGDWDRWIYGFKKCRELMYSSNLAAYYTNQEEEMTPGWDVQTDEEIIAHARATTGTDWHPMSSNRMGTSFDDDDMIVVNNRLQVRGVRNLRVVDGSIIPAAISGNPNQITMIIAAKAADIILEDN